MAQPAGAERGPEPGSSVAGERRRTRRWNAGGWRAGLVATVSLSLALGLGPTLARADGPMVRYQGLHPLSPHQGAFCYIDAPHMHRIPPPDLRVYLVLKDGTNVFIGDPVALGYDGPKFGFYGPHPLAIAGVSELPSAFCYMSGPHYHAAPLAPSPALIEKAGVTWYVGPVPPPPDPGRIWINEVHPIASYAPPKVDLGMAPPGYHAFTSPVAVPAAAPTPAPPKAGKSKAPAGAHPPAPPRPAKPPAGAPVAPAAPSPGGQP